MVNRYSKANSKSIPLGISLMEMVVCLTVMTILSGITFKGYSLVKAYLDYLNCLQAGIQIRQVFIDYKGYYGSHPGRCFRSNQWINLQEDNKWTCFLEFMSPQAREGVNVDKVDFLRNLSREKPTKPLWIYLRETVDSEGESFLQPMEELQGMVDGNISEQQIVGWNSDILLFVPRR